MGLTKSISSSPILQLSQLTKRWGRHTAVDNMDLTVERGSIFGLLGPNGSGKTTTLGMLLGVLQPTSGTFHWDLPGKAHEKRRHIGAILEHPCFYPYMTGYQNLELAATIKEASPHRVDDVLQLVGLYERRHDKYRTYSLGMKQRLAIGAALLPDPDVLILDEPTNGLDPAGIVQIRNLIRDIGATGKTIILASHLLDEVQRVCSDFMVLRQGEVLYVGSVQSALGDKDYLILDAPDRDKLIAALHTIAPDAEVQETADYIELRGLVMELSDLNARLHLQGISLSRLSRESGSLEQEFLAILDQDHHG